MIRLVDAPRHVRLAARCIAYCPSTAKRTASTTTSSLSPGISTSRPLCSAIFGSNSSARIVFEGLEIGALVRSDQAGVACHIGAKDRSEPAGLAHPRRQPPVADPQAQAGPQLAHSMASLPPLGDQSSAALADKTIYAGLRRAGFPEE